MTNTTTTFDFELPFFFDTRTLETDYYIGLANELADWKSIPWRIEMKDVVYALTNFYGAYVFFYQYQPQGLLKQLMAYACAIGQLGGIMWHLTSESIDDLVFVQMTVFPIVFFLFDALLTSPKPQKYLLLLTNLLLYVVDMQSPPSSEPGFHTVHIATHLIKTVWHYQLIGLQDARPLGTAGGKKRI
ncbi:expressed unknown protein [Seminavis robusta]|uniref:Uncharacterized protein n=1 Tax=Seminavis robusta TaxID=568900 RepID=A0A9N8EJM2_9STRA|nr:expressed unknown protein [Seminavis robusta]|eukprot:Sro1093_g240370.1 n/a (187) ;mRNA; f:9933-10493